MWKSAFVLGTLLASLVAKVTLFVSPYDWSRDDPTTHTAPAFSGETKLSSEGHHHWYDVFVPTEFKATDWLLAIFTGLLVLYTRRLFVVTAGLKGSTDKLWEAGEEQAKRIERQIKIAESDLTKTRRAFVFLANLEVLPMPDKEGPIKFWRIVPEWKNSGTTPAKKLTIRTNWVNTLQPDLDLPDNFQYAYSKKPLSVFMGPRATVLSDAIDIPVEIVTSKGSGIFIWGRADYADVFADTAAHFTEFCVRLRYRKVGLDPPLGNGGEGLVAFVPHGPHNRSDEDV